MQMKQTGSLRRSAQAGFTLIELIVVIVILGILAATALPKFAEMGGEARVAKMNAAAASVKTAVAMFRGKWLAGGTNAAANYTVEGTSTQVAVNSSGYVTTGSIALAAGLTTDYSMGTAADNAIDIRADTNHTSCKISYSENDGSVTNTATSTNCN